jgi:hypothetical protein
VWKAIQLGNVNVLNSTERDRLLTLRENFNLQGKVTACDANPMNKGTQSGTNCGCSTSSNTNDISEQAIREIVEKVILKLKTN